MNIVTISREFGSGGRELGKRLADELGYDYYDREIITAIAKEEGLDEGYVERALNNHGWQAVPLRFGGSFAAVSAPGTRQVELLLDERKIIEKIGSIGKNCVIVGRNADVLLAEHHPLNLFVCAQMEARVERCLRRAVAGENLSAKEMRRQIRQIDGSRARSRELIGGAPWGQRDQYHLVVNTTGMDMKKLSEAIADFARKFFGEG